jgi:putative flippase GtrA
VADRLEAAVPPGRSLGAVFGRFLLVGLLSYLADAGTLWLLHGGLGVPLLGATSIAFTVGLTVNYGLNRVLTFGSGARVGYEVSRYLLLVLANYVVTVGLVGGLTAAGLPYLASKTVTTAVLAIANFVAYRQWVFRAR